MLDIQLLRKDLTAVKTRMADRGTQIDWERFTELEERRKSLQSSTEYLQSQRNSKSKEIAQAKAKGDERLAAQIMAEVAEFGDRLKSQQADLDVLQQELNDFLLTIPNMPHVSVPTGRLPDDNREMRRVGDPRSFGFAVKDHADLGAGLGMLDFEAAVKISGARF